MRWLLVLVLVALLFLFLGTDAHLYVDYLWFQSERVTTVFATTLRYRAVIYVLFGGAALAWLLLNWLAARSLARRQSRGPRTLVVDQRRHPPIVTLALVVVAVVLSLVFASGASGAWQLFALFIHQQPITQTDPILHRSVAWYLFTYPVLQYLYGWVVTLLFLTLVGVVITYALYSPQFVQLEPVGAMPGQMRVSLSPPRQMLLHGAGLIALFLLIQGAAYHWLSTAGLLFAAHKTFFGADFVDTHVHLAAYDVLTAVMVFSAVAIVLAAVRESAGWALAVPIAWLSVAILGLGVIPALVQAVYVAPSELSREAPYIANNIRFTRSAFALDQITVQHPKLSPLTEQDVINNQATIQNIRLWDWRPLQETFQQLQGLRPYYLFRDVGIDRYNGQQEMLAARQLDISRLPQAAQNWQNRHLVYTHGFGVVGTPAQGVTQQGTPEFNLHDIPPVTNNPSLRITQPRIYFTSGGANRWLLVDTKAQEFDYPTGSENASTHYTGTAGIAVGSLPRRLLFAYALGDPNLLYTSYLDASSKILIHRELSDLIHQIAPFLKLDHDPYIVISGGHLYWFQDAYTESSTYPYSTPLNSGVNYIRNSVKIIVDAYNGTVTFYRTDSPAHPEPLIQAYSEIFPGLFHPLSQMPADFRAHLRYPEDLFDAQAQTMLLYHMTDPTVFYNREDVWSLPVEQVGGTRSQLQPYYVEIRLPGEQQAEFVLIEPFVPRGKDNMIAWLAARSDPAHYGQALLYEFSKDSLIYGPQQVEARIDQDPMISSSLTLWNQQGSRVIRGNLLVIPLGKAFLYVEPLFLQASQGRIPELKRVILADSNNVTMQRTLKEALSALFSGTPPAGASNVPNTSNQPAPAAAATATPVAAPSANATMQQLARDALQHYGQAQQDLKNGDWAGYGKELAAMQRDLERLATGR
ncbi:MAG: UPF0182 family protein [Chloroflexi bacterium]|nr:UPF0182 family protein [Chloroflexota bacterium]